MSELTPEDRALRIVDSLPPGYEVGLGTRRMLVDRIAAAITEATADLTDKIEAMDRGHDRFVQRANQEVFELRALNIDLTAKLEAAERDYSVDRENWNARLTSEQLAHRETQEYLEAAEREIEDRKEQMARLERDGERAENAVLDYRAQLAAAEENLDSRRLDIETQAKRIIDLAAELAIVEEDRANVRRELAKNDRHYLKMVEELAAVQGEKDELQQTFDLRHRADQQAIALWQAAHPERPGLWPDHADLVVWLMEQIKSTTEAPHDPA